MKLKMPCKLCDSISHPKLGVVRADDGGGATCTHTDYVLSSHQAMPSMMPIGLQVQDPTILVPQIRDMMLAAYLFRGEIIYAFLCKVVKI